LDLFLTRPCQRFYHLITLLPVTKSEQVGRNRRCDRGSKPRLSLWCFFPCSRSLALPGRPWNLAAFPQLGATFFPFWRAPLGAKQQRKGKTTDKPEKSVLIQSSLLHHSPLFSFLLFFFVNLIIPPASLEKVSGQAQQVVVVWCGCERARWKGKRLRFFSVATISEIGWWAFVRWW
jgi:hypothetical protein